MPTKVVAVVGPTASGKSALALQIAESVGGEIVCCDSMQVYRGMDIGTAKPTAEEQARVPHHLLDLADPDDQLNARRFAELAEAAIEGIVGRGALPVIVGGTGLWLRALLHGLMEAPAADPALRSELERLDPPTRHARLAAVDPAAAARIHANDAVRTLRALEVFELTGRPISDQHDQHDAGPARYDALKLGLRWPREELYARIDARTEAMFAAGFVDEVRALLDSGYPRTLRPMGALGYKHLCAALAGEITTEDAVRLTQRDTRKYAKRQFTWFNKEPHVTWLDAPASGDGAVTWVRLFLEGRA